MAQITMVHLWCVFWIAASLTVAVTLVSSISTLPVQILPFRCFQYGRPHYLDHSLSHSMQFISEKS